MTVEPKDSPQEVTYYLAVMTQVAELSLMMVETVKVIMKMEAVG
jgi:hypothetical protein